MNIKPLETLTNNMESTADKTLGNMRSVYLSFLNMLCDLDDGSDPEIKDFIGDVVKETQELDSTIKYLRNEMDEIKKLQAKFKDSMQ